MDMVLSVQQPSKKSVLVLEEDANEATMIERALRNAACEAFVCRNTSEAKAYVSGSGMYANRNVFPMPDLIVAAIRMRDDGGIEFLAWLREQDSEVASIPVIVLSEVATPADHHAINRLGISKFLAKPSDSIALHDLLLQATQGFCRGEQMLEGAGARHDRLEAP